MFFRYIYELFRPLRSAQAKVQHARGMKARVSHDINQVKSLKGRAKAGAAKAKAGAAKAKAGAAKAKAGAAKVGGAGGQVQPTAAVGATPAAASPGGRGPAAVPGPAPGQGAHVTTPEVEKKGFWCFKKHYCAQCGEQLEKTWDQCPYCGPAAPQPESSGPGPRTRALMVDAAGAGSQMQLLGWLVPLKGPQRGELYTLAPLSIVGTDAGCTVCLSDQFMSAQHAEIKVEGGVWMLRDLGSTNGTYVNDKRIDVHELVDNDFVQFGQSLAKFKTL